MILIISTCKERLSEEEFVKPIVKLVDEPHTIKHYTTVTNNDLHGAKKVIICGTALQDNDYLKNLHFFNWLNDYGKPVLSICSGMQILALKNEATITSEQEIGMIQIKTTKKNPLFEGEFEAYGLHQNGLENLKNFDILAKSKDAVQAIKHKEKPFYGILFHPEVRQNSVISEFLAF